MHDTKRPKHWNWIRLDKKQSPAEAGTRQRGLGRFISYWEHIKNYKCAGIWSNGEVNSVHKISYLFVV